ncbi:MAG: phosphomannomutase/phosphoglucomutase [Chromatiales bacterium]
MSRKKNTDASAEQQGASGSGRSLRSFINAVFISAAVVLLIGAGAAYVLQQQSIGTLTQQNAVFAAESTARTVQRLVNDKAELLSLLADNDAIRSALIDEDLDKLQQLAKQMQQKMPDSMQLRFLPKDYNETQPNAAAPLTHASLDMLHRALKQQGVLAAEVHSPNSGGRHIAMGAAVRNAAGEPIGVVHLASNPLLLDQVFEGLPESAGIVVLQQVVGSQAVVLANSPSYSSDVNSFDGTIDIEGSIWKVAYRSVVGASLLDVMMLPAILLIGILPIAIVAFWKTTQLKQALKFDQASMIRIVEAKLQGKVKHHLGNVSLLENKDTLAILSQLHGPSGAKPQAASASGSRESDADEAETESADFDLGPSASDVQHEEVSDTVVPPTEIFREYDIRGVVGKTLTLESAFVIGQAIGSLAREQGETSILLGRDGRLSSKDLATAMGRGLTSTGLQVIDLGMAPTPVLYFATHFLSASSGVMVTGSHNPLDHNGFKVVINRESLSGDAIRGLHKRIASQDFASGDGSLTEQDIVPDYLNRITEEVHLLAPLKLVVDCGNGVAGVAAKALFEQLGCEVSLLYCDVDGNFPNHHPDPGNPDNLKALQAAVTENGADLGVAFDGDADRIGVVDSSGKVIMPDRVLMLLAGDVLLRNPGADVIYDVKSSKHLATHILSAGGRPIMWKSGHSLMKAKLSETGALLAGEFSGHIFFKERWYGFDDALYAAARLLEVISGDGRSSAEMFAEIPESASTPELQLEVAEGKQFEVMRQLAGGEKFPNAKIVEIDGVRAEYPGAWGLVRASHTTPSLVFRFEADTPENLAKVQALFRQVISGVLPDAKLPF